eukprot:TRINITY_DN3986_c0_g1_i5.p1 TRINITY_DN3986_c0_g1~~TRINITY_DN3986_c0_g1_i5.p1  ORF type:complete len:131 (+),score=16.08 TRINITY_DN3986_c0_g1_i5:258-650(+)
MKAIAQRWQGYVDNKKWILQDNVFWNYYTPFWEMPDYLEAAIKESSLIIIKGDANYRRVHGDLKWDFSTPTSEITSYFSVPICLIRTLKSETVSGISKDVVKLLFEKEKDWFYSGSYGHIQFINKKQITQ